MKLPWSDRAVPHWTLFRVAALGLLLGGAYRLGAFMGAEDFDALLELPPGGVYLSTRTHTIVAASPDNPQWLHLTRVPTPKQARLVRLFPTVVQQAPTTSEGSTTTTTVPKEGKKP